MRVLFASYSEKTHFLTMVPLAWALQTAGHEVRVASQPGFASVITGAGLTAVPVGRDHALRMLLQSRTMDPEPEPEFDFAENRPEVLTWEYLQWGYNQVVPWWWRTVNDSMIGELVQFCRHWRPDLVVWEPVTYAGPVAAKACGAAHARFMWSVDLFGRMRRNYVRERDRQPSEQQRDVLRHWLAARIARYGAEYTEDVTTGQFTLDFIPPALRTDPTEDLDLDLDYVSIRYVPYNGTSVIEPWLRAVPGRPRIGLTLGTTATTLMNGYGVSVREILDALADLDVEVVATLPQTEQDKLGRAPDNARLVTYAPLNALAPTCAVMISHGGPGTYFTTLLHGVPQLVLYQGIFDDQFIGRYAQKQGAGLTMPMGEVTGAKVRDSVRRLLAEDSFRVNAQRLRREAGEMPTPNKLVPELERLTAKYRPAGPPR